MNTKNIIYWVARILAAIIMAQTLFFKFSGAEESIAIFTKMGVEPWGRYLTGIAELAKSWRCNKKWCEAGEGTLPALPNWRPRFCCLSTPRHDGVAFWPVALWPGRLAHIFLCWASSRMAMAVICSSWPVP